MKKLPILLIAIFAVFLSACGKNYSNGTRAGTITKLSKKGFICKSWEGEMVMGGARTVTSDSGSSVVANVWAFNVDPSAVEKVQQAMNSGRRVELVYRQWALSPPSIDSDYVVIDVRTLD